jgi:hypothetical protein
MVTVNDAEATKREEVVNTQLAILISRLGSLPNAENIVLEDVRKRVRSGIAHIAAAREPVGSRHQEPLNRNTNKIRGRSAPRCRQVRKTYLALTKSNKSPFDAVSL